MAVIVFVSGRPGSGKSQVARCLADKSLDSSSEDHPWKDRQVVRITDYDILYNWFQEDKQKGLLGQRFEESEYGGFRVTEFSVLHEALVEVNKKIKAEIGSEKGLKKKLILVEFARSAYEQGIWSAFDSEIREQAYFLYLKADLQVCKKRVKRRVLDNPLRCEDDTFVPADIMDGYYQQERFSDLYQIASPENVKVVNNSGEWDDTWNEVKEYFHAICSLQELPSGLTKVPHLSSITKFPRIMRHKQRLKRQPQQKVIR